MTSEEPVPIAVVGVGHLGKHHARLLQGLPEARLVAVADKNPEARDAAAKAYGVPVLADYRELPDEVRAATVAVPTRDHRVVAGHLLERGLDVLVEKPIAPSVKEGQELVDLAERGDRILQVGHVERYNPTLKAIQDLGMQVRYIEGQRLSSFSFRSTDIGVVLDLMIHDLDLVLTMVGSNIASVDAFGGAVFTPAEDMASAILKFENGAVAHLTASRVALKTMRRMRLFSPEGYASLDFQSAKGLVIRKNPGWDLQRLDLESLDLSKIGDLWKFVFEGLLSMQEYKLDEGNPLRDELQAFLHSVRTRTPPEVGGVQGLAAVAAAEKVLAAIARNPW